MQMNMKTSYWKGSRKAGEYEPQKVMTGDIKGISFEYSDLLICIIEEIPEGDRSEVEKLLYDITSLTWAVQEIVCLC